ncbi:beta-1,4-glucuronyltransferase 1-like [Actinia tenebrosa]|uniref:Beta-1,4-glucuronyltransferase 1 n=1 Tax=Actinia tenebrosa TaxID=6105 RepID=A0A6P8J2L9_ACTTE|nr:beta-1,4-glucuronyltransferase 1-like [Actinia tenebrosa]
MNVNFSTGKLVVLLAVLGIGVGFVNFFLVSRFNRQQQSALERNTSGRILSLFSNKNMDFSKLDIDPLGEYRVQPNFMKATGSTRKRHDVSMVTHCTINNLHYLLNLVHHWKGSISIAVIVPGLDIIVAYKSIIGLHICSSKIRERVSFHVVYPLSHPALMNDLMYYAKQARKVTPRSCEEFLVGMQTTGVIQNKNYANIQIPYPNNLLRNIARSNADKDYIFMVDIDMMCNGNLYHDFLKFAEDNNLFGNSQDMRVFVVPAFESQESVSVDLTKNGLIQLWDSGKIQPFYFKACWKCQRPTNYEDWKRHKSKSTGLDISHKVEWEDPWEPFYIGPYHVPMYDDRFKKYGFNRISQVCETHIAGYDFAVLDNAFLVHHGFKNKFHKKKDEENDINRKLFRKFKQELKKKYPDSKRRC